MSAGLWVRLQTGPSSTTVNVAYVSRVDVWIGREEVGVYDSPATARIGIYTMGLADPFVIGNDSLTPEARGWINAQTEGALLEAVEEAKRKNAKRRESNDAE